MGYRAETFKMSRSVFSPDLRPYDKLFLVTLIFQTSEKCISQGEVVPASNSELKKASSMSLRAIPAIRRPLAAIGLISFEPGGPGRMTRYTLHLERLPHLPDPLLLDELGALLRQKGG